MLTRPTLAMVGAMLTMTVLALGQERKAVRRIEQGYHTRKQRRAAAEAEAVEAAEAEAETRVWAATALQAGAHACMARRALSRQRAESVKRRGAKAPG